MVKLVFFLIKVHAYKIGDSNPAPMFNIIEQPNDFADNVRAIENRNLNKSQTERLEFWTKFNDILENRKFPFNKRKATTDHWYSAAIGSSLCHIQIDLVNKENRIRISIYILNDKDLFDSFFNNKESIENELGYNLEWNRMEDAKTSMISKYIYNLDFDNHSNYNQLINETIDIVNEFKKVFKKYL